MMFKNFKLSLLILAIIVAINPFFANSAGTEAGRKAMVEKLVGKNSKIITSAPFADEDYLPLSQQNVAFMAGGVCRAVNWGDSQQVPTSDLLGSSIYSDNNDYAFTATGTSKGKTDNIFVVSFCNRNNDIQATISIYNPITGAQNRVFASYDKNVFNNFASNYDFVEELRISSSSGYYDPFSGYVSNNIKRNEVVSSMVSLVANDYNGDGVDDLYLLVRNKLTIYDGVTLAVLNTYTFNFDSKYEDISVGAAAADFTGEGVKEYVAIVLGNQEQKYMLGKQFSEAKAIVVPNMDGNTKPAILEKKINASDLISTTKAVWHPTISLEPFYYNGMGTKPMLAVATSAPYSYDEYALKINFCHTLTLLSIERLVMDNDNTSTKWYSKAHQENFDTKAYHRETPAFRSVLRRDRPFLFGRPTLKQAFCQGLGERATLLWLYNFYKWSDKSKLEKIHSLMSELDVDRTGLSNAKLDRIICGEAVAYNLPCSNKTDIVKGRQAFMAVTVTSHYVDDGVFNKDCDWKDRNYKITRFFFDDKGSFTKYDATSSELVKDAELGFNSPISLAAYSTEPGMKVKIVKTEVSSTNPIIECVLALPPYIDGVSDASKVSVSYSETTGEGSSKSETQSKTNTYTISLNMPKMFKFIVSKGMSTGWSKGAVAGTTTSVSTTLTPTHTTDFVIFNYMPIDKFTYEVTEAPDTSLIGQQFTMIGVRGAQIYKAGLSLEKYNDMAEAAGCYVIGDNVLNHKPGDVSSYKGGSGHSGDGLEQIRKEFGVGDEDFFQMSPIMSVPDESSSLKVSLSKGSSDSKSSGKTSSSTSSVSVDFLNGLPLSFTNQLSENNSEGWTVTTSWSDNYSVSGSIPGVTNVGNNYYSFRQVWYRFKDEDKNLGSQDFMVCNWYVTENDINPDWKEDIAEIPVEKNAGVNVEQNFIEVVTKQKAQVDVYTIDGLKVYTKAVDGSANISLSPGTYIVKAGDVTKKVMIK